VPPAIANASYKQQQDNPGLTEQVKVARQARSVSDLSRRRANGPQPQ
jgi:hypothetical protein